MLRFEGVSFNEQAVMKMSKADFMAKHIDVFWLDRTKVQRRKMLNTVYALIEKKNRQ